MSSEGWACRAAVLSMQLLEHLLHSFPQERYFWDWSVSLEIGLEMGPKD